jgi:hypothetical protein
MQCPHDQTVLQMTERHGIEIDYCPLAAGYGWTAASSTRSSSGRAHGPSDGAAQQAAV